ncbi:hypothetical protein PG994_012967 [Apiospora phragmitis]|uniref:PQ loop repeat protein n=1 Tax=Apiospora phragmitis TaxID=2905665 RepID=A0ABR1T9I2_9PEZI
MGSFLDMMEDRCAELQRVGYTNFFVSILIIIGILFSYLLQHYRIISRGTSEGISPYFVLLGVTSANSQFANILALPQSRADVGCCKQVSPLECAAGLLGIAQIGVQWICFAVILVLFLVFFRRDETIPDDDDDEVIDPDQPTWRTAIGVAAACLIHGLLIVIISASLALGAPDYLAMWANILGIMSAALAAIQYVPQIWTTYHLKHAGSLSIPMMCVQTPGGFLFAASLGARLGWAGWSSWGVIQPPHHAPGSSLAWSVLGPSPAYAETQEEIEAALDREAVQGLGENQPLLAPGGIGSSGVR